MIPPLTIRVLVVDDHPVWREGVIALLKREPDMVVAGEAVNGEEAVRLFEQLQPNVVLMDLRMPDMDGITAIGAICGKYRSAHILVLSTFDGDEDVYRALRAGARGYLFKDVARSELLEAIRQVHAGRQYIPQNVASRLAERVVHQSEELTEREVEVLRLIAAGKSNQEISAELSIVEGTVKAHIGSILRKLSAAHRTQAVTVALQRGIIHL